MAKKEVFYYTSVQGSVKIHAVYWLPEDGQIHGIVQLAHGMSEYVERYGYLAEFLTSRGFLVTGNDHLGHGGSVCSEAEYGYFYERNGNQYLVQDMEKLRKHTEKKYPGQPYFILGHSMGSFLLRQYLLYYGSGLNGAIIMGTGSQPPALLAAGRMLTTIMALFRGWHYRSRLVRQMTFGTYNKRFEPARTEADWLSSDEQVTDAYMQDEKCGFTFTLNGYHNMFSGMLVISRKQNLRKLPQDIPLFLVSGEEDPVGAAGAGVRQLYETYKQLGIRDVSMKLYQHDRHEILNEPDKEQVCADIYEWINRHR